MNKIVNDKIYSYEYALESSKDYFDGDDLAAKVFIDKYALKDRDGNILEKDPDQMFDRAALEIYRIEKSKFKKPFSFEFIKEVIGGFRRVIPQGSPLYGIGNIYQYVSLSNCFVIKSPVDSYGGICLADQEIVQISKRRGGVGLDISNLRPNGAITRNAAKTSTGIVSFMERFSRSIREVGQSGRRGALLISISVHHPDIIDFVNVKMDLTKVTGANISIRLSDEFLTAVKNNTEYEQRFPVDSKNPTLKKMASAKVVWDAIITSAHSMGEPGLLFWDTIIKESPADCYSDVGFKSVSTNPCFPQSEYLLTEKGYCSFGDLFVSKNKNKIVCDSRISYKNNGNEKPENWEINVEKEGTVTREASEVFLTQEQADIIEIETSKGFKLRCTPDHHIATTDGMIEAQNLNLNHEILISIPENQGSIVGKEPEATEEIISFLLGLLIGDGTVGKKKKQVHLDFWGEDSERMIEKVKTYIDFLYDKFGERKNIKNKKYSKYFVSYSKDISKIRLSSTWLGSIMEEFGVSLNNKFEIPEFILNNSATNIGKFFVLGLMYSDGTVGGSKKSGYTVRLSQSNEDLLRKVQLILHSNGMVFGIYSRREAQYRDMTDGKGGHKKYFTKENYELTSVNGAILKYRDSIGFFNHPKKQNFLDSIEHNFRIKKSFTDSLVKTTTFPKESVYCLREDIGRNIIVNGISARRCGEIVLCPSDSCRLLSLNLFGYVNNPFEHKASFDYNRFKEDAKIAQRIQDDIIDLEIEALNRILEKIKEDPEDEYIKKVETNIWEETIKRCADGRRTGTGITALGDTLAALGIPYGSEESIEETGKIYQTLKLGCYESSVEMAKELGAFPVWNYEKEMNNPFLLRIKEEDPKLYNDMKRYGRRNIAILTSAPTGTISLLSQTTSGIEPCFQLSYKRRKKINQNDNDTRVDFVDNNGDKWQEFDVYHPKFKMWSSITGETDIKKSPWHGCCAEDIDWTNRVKLQALANKHIDHSISSTVNLPESATKEEVANIYKTAWESGVKGITVYRNNCRSGVLVDKNKKTDSMITKNNSPKRPQDLMCDIYNNVKVKGESYFVIIGLFGKEPYEIFAGKNGFMDNSIRKAMVRKIIRGKYSLINCEDKKTVIYDNISDHISEEQEAITRLISSNLRHGCDVNFIVHQLEKTKGDLSGFAKAICRILKKYIPDGKSVSGEECPTCSSKLIRREGCVSCESCGYSRCS